MKNEIDITKGIPNISNMLVLSGRELGEKQRRKLEIENLDTNDNEYTIHIPKNIISINSSFFLGAFGNSVRHFKTKEHFLEKYQFDCNPNAFVTINDGINDALNNVDILE